ncbi:hypothetical protein ACLB2K_034552 [Fragaria x ananassa]
MTEITESSRRALVNTLERRFFYIPSFKIYGGVAGLYDYGSPSCKLKKNVLALWHQHFVLQENMWEIDCPCLTPEAVLKASGHVDKFSDLMVKDVEKGTCYRADHLLKDLCIKKLERLEEDSEMAMELKELLSKLDGLSAEELGLLLYPSAAIKPTIPPPSTTTRRHLTLHKPTASIKPCKTLPSNLLPVCRHQTYRRPPQAPPLQARYNPSSLAETPTAAEPCKSRRTKPLHILNHNHPTPPLPV